MENTFFIIFLILLGIASYSEEKQKNKEKIAKQWGSITIGMTKDDILSRFGKPNRIWQAGSAEIWGYGSRDSDGLVKFLDQIVIGYQKPD